MQVNRYPGVPLFPLDPLSSPQCHAWKCSLSSCHSMRRPSAGLTDRDLQLQLLQALLQGHPAPSSTPQNPSTRPTSAVPRSGPVTGMGPMTGLLLEGNPGASLNRGQLLQALFKLEIESQTPKVGRHPSACMLSTHCHFHAWLLSQVPAAVSAASLHQMLECCIENGGSAAVVDTVPLCVTCVCGSLKCFVATWSAKLYAKADMILHAAAHSLHGG